MISVLYLADEGLPLDAVVLDHPTWEPLAMRAALEAQQLFMAPVLEPVRRAHRLVIAAGSTDGPPNPTAHALAGDRAAQFSGPLLVFSEHERSHLVVSVRPFELLIACTFVLVGQAVRAVEEARSPHRIAAGGGQLTQPQQKE